MGAKSSSPLNNDTSLDENDVTSLYCGGGGRNVDYYNHKLV